MEYLKRVRNFSQFDIENNGDSNEFTLSADQETGTLLKEGCKIRQSLTESPISLWASVSVLKKYIQEYTEVGSMIDAIFRRSGFRARNLREATVNKFHLLVSQLRIYEQKWMRKVWRMRNEGKFFSPGSDEPQKDLIFMPINFHIHKLEVVTTTKRNAWSHYTMGIPNVRSRFAKELARASRSSKIGNDSNVDCWGKYIGLAGIWAYGLDVELVFLTSIKTELRRFQKSKGQEYAVLYEKIDYCRRTWARLVDYYNDADRELVTFIPPPSDVQLLLDEMCEALQRNRSSSAVQKQDMDLVVERCAKVDHMLKTGFLCYPRKYAKCFNRIVDLQSNIIKNRVVHIRNALLHCQLIGGIIGGVYDHFNNSDMNFEELRKRPEIPIVFNYALSCYGDEKGLVEDFENILKKIENIDIRIEPMIEKLDKKMPSIYPNVTKPMEINLGASTSIHSSNFTFNLEINPQLFSRLFPEPEDQTSTFTEFHLEPFFFNVGIDRNAERAIRAHRKRPRTPHFIEQTIGLKSLERLSSYAKKRLGSSFVDGSIKSKLESLEMLLGDPYVSKQNQILHLAASIVRDLDGLVFFGCRNANDRTSMVLTYDQVELAKQVDVLRSDDSSKDLLDILRLNGTTIHLAKKSTGIEAYRFTDPVSDLLSDYVPPAKVLRSE